MSTKSQTYKDILMYCKLILLSMILYFYSKQLIVIIMLSYNTVCPCLSLSVLYTSYGYLAHEIQSDL